jgi:hypothetical protein
VRGKKKMTNENATENLVDTDLAVQEVVEMAAADTTDGADDGAVYFQTEAEIGDEKEVTVH